MSGKLSFVFHIINDNTNSRSFLDGQKILRYITISHAFIDFQNRYSVFRKYLQTSNHSVRKVTCKMTIEYLNAN